MTNCCKECSKLIHCGGWERWNGQPFDGSCIIKRNTNFDEFRRKLINNINTLVIDELVIKELFLLNNDYVNLEYPLSNGTTVRFLNDHDVYLGAQIERIHFERCYGVVTNEDFILVFEYGYNGLNLKLFYTKEDKVNQIDDLFTLTSFLKVLIILNDWCISYDIYLFILLNLLVEK